MENNYLYFIKGLNMSLIYTVLFYFISTNKDMSHMNN